MDTSMVKLIQSYLQNRLLNFLTTFIRRKLKSPFLKLIHSETTSLKILTLHLIKKISLS